MRRAVLTLGATVERGGAPARDAVDAGRLRRMDRFGRSGFLAGSRVLAGAGVGAAHPGIPPDPRFGVIVGTAYGCRDAVTEHARLLVRAGRAADLAPSVFVATVHNAAGGELATVHALGGVAETLVSGRTAGLEALALAASRVARGDADRILVVGAEGIDETMAAAWARENPGIDLVESAAAVLVEAEEGEREERKEDSSSKRKSGGAFFLDAEFTFDAASQRGKYEEHVFSEGVREGEAPRIERLGASGLWEIALDLEAARRAPAAGAPPPDAPSERIHRYTVRDVHGSCAALTLAFFS